MLNRKRKRVKLIFLGLFFLILSSVLIGYAMKDGIEFFKSPSELNDNPPKDGKRFRLGGLVAENSVKMLKNGGVSFLVTDNFAFVEVQYFGILPDLFEENQGVIAAGVLGTDVIFYADEVFAKHDENYMPKEVVDMLKQKGVYVKPSGED